MSTGHISQPPQPTQPLQAFAALEAEAPPAAGALRAAINAAYRSDERQAVRALLDQAAAFPLAAGDNRQLAGFSVQLKFSFITHNHYSLLYVGYFNLTRNICADQ